LAITFIILKWGGALEHPRVRIEVGYGGRRGSQEPHENC